jgi:hypothetical protein
MNCEPKQYIVFAEEGGLPSSDFKPFNNLQVAINSVNNFLKVSKSAITTSWAITEVLPSGTRTVARAVMENGYFIEFKKI